MSSCSFGKIVYHIPCALRQTFSLRFRKLGCDCKLLNLLTDIKGIRVLSRSSRPTRSSRAPLRHDSDARAFTRALYRGGRNHIRPTNVLSCASRLQDPSPRHAKMNDSVLNNGIKTLPFRIYISKLEEDSPNA